MSDDESPPRSPIQFGEDEHNAIISDISPIITSLFSERSGLRRGALEEIIKSLRIHTNLTKGDVKKFAGNLIPQRIVASAPKQGAVSSKKKPSKTAKKRAEEAQIRDRYGENFASNPEYHREIKAYRASLKEQ